MMSLSDEERDNGWFPGVSLFLEEEEEERTGKEWKVVEWEGVEESKSGVLSGGGGGLAEEEGLKTEQRLGMEEDDMIDAIGSDWMRESEVPPPHHSKSPALKF